MHTTLGSKSMRWAAALVVAGSVALPGCTTVQKNANASSYLIVESIQAAAGVDPTKLGGSLASDVLTNGVRYEDPGAVVLRLAMVDPSNPAGPSTTNFITVNRYHVRYIRTDGGAGVPAEFDGFASLTIGLATDTLPITLVRAQAKGVSPLVDILSNPGQHILTQAEVTIFGTDQAGHEVQVVAHISVDFANWADPA